MKLHPISLAAVVLLMSAFSILMVSCSNSTSGDKSQHADNTQAVDSAKASDPFPVADWFRSEISYVDSVPLAIIAYHIDHNRRDSSFLSPGQFHRMAAGAFLLPDLEAPTWRKDFAESSFFDKTTGYLTFTYASRNKELSLQRVDVLVKQGEVSNIVKSVYLETYTNKADTLVVKKMFWTARHDFQVITNERVKGQPERQQQLQVVWDAE